jgi:hypothetical protein
LINAARHLPAGTMMKSVFASAAFDLATLVQTRGRALGAVARGWRDGLGLMASERGARTPEERRAAARRLVSLRKAFSEQRRLRRLQSGA